MVAPSGTDHAWLKYDLNGDITFEFYKLFHLSERQTLTKCPNRWAIGSISDTVLAPFGIPHSKQNTYNWADVVLKLTHLESTAIDRQHGEAFVEGMVVQWISITSSRLFVYGYNGWDRWACLLGSQCPR